ncbi:ABC transporter permease [Shinella sp. PSBB067]|uniref:ABC transporter permease n=1 Tax=Shinella TaxID=323620 RepID=UPI00193C7708|nr:MULTISPECIES: ABC transporter permease [Shinella]QRI62546.1 ABC transporter permease [Shinella sp. PSBB067]
MRATRAIFSTVMVGFLLGPLVAILPLAFTSSMLLVYPVPSWSFRWFEELVINEEWRRSIYNSLVIGIGTTVLATSLGTAAALGLRGRVSLSASGFRTLFMLPMVVPPVVLGIGLQMLIPRLGLTDSYAAVIIAHSVLAAPFVLICVRGALGGVDQRVELAAASLGASPFVVFRRVTLPLIMPGVASGAVLSFATSLDEVVLTLFVAGPNQRTLARQMFSSIRENISPTIASAAFILIVGTVIISLLIHMLRSRNRSVAG